MQPSTGQSGLAHGFTTLITSPIRLTVPDDMVEVLIMCMKWNMSSRRHGIRSEGPKSLTALHRRAVDLLELLKSNLPDKCGEKGGWNFDKAQSILHKVREIIMWGNTRQLL
jgi:hypothetical protein